MGKLITYIVILIFIDLLFFATGQICSVDDCTLSSAIFGAIMDIKDVTLSEFFEDIIGILKEKINSTKGILSLGAAGAVIVGAFVATKEFRLLLIPTFLVFALITSDFVTIGAMLISLNHVLGSFIMIPIIIIYSLVAVEWLIGKD